MGLKDFFVETRSMEPEEARKFIREHDEGAYTLLDVRQPAEHAEYRIPGAKLIPLPELADSLELLDPDKTTLVYCAVGKRSLAAAKLLIGRGFREVYNIEGGIRAWQGGVAKGPRELALYLLRGAFTVKDVVQSAYHMERGLAAFYSGLADKAESPELKNALLKLAGVEDRHIALVLQLYEDMGFDPQDIGSANDPQVMEGGLSLQEMMDQARESIRTPLDVIGSGMMFEAQAMDLYMRFSEETNDETVKAVLLTLAGEEKKHLEAFAILMEKATRKKQG